MKGFHDNIEVATEGNELFRKVLYTGHNMQLVLMTLQPGEASFKDADLKAIADRVVAAAGKLGAELRG